MPTSPLKRPSAGGRLGRLLASLRPPSRAGPLPVQTGFPTSLADLVVKNHVRLKNPRRRHRTTAAPPSVAASVAELSPPPQQQQQQRREPSPVQNAVVRSKAKGAAFSIRPELLAAGGAVALALLVIWSKWLVAAATAASVALFWIESVRSPASRRRPRPETADQDVCGGRGYGLVSPIREAESEADTPRSSSADSDDRGSEVSSLADADATTDLGDDSVTPKTKEKRRSLRKLIGKKLRNGKRSKDRDSTASRDGGESKHPDAGVNPGQVQAEPLPAPAADTTPPDAFPNERSRHGGAFPTAAFIPIVLVGLVAGKLPAVALTVLCAVFFSSVERLPAS